MGMNSSFVVHVCYGYGALHLWVWLRFRWLHVYRCAAPEGFGRFVVTVRTVRCTAEKLNRDFLCRNTNISLNLRML